MKQHEKDAQVSAWFRDDPVHDPIRPFAADALTGGQVFGLCNASSVERKPCLGCGLPIPAADEDGLCNQCFEAEERRQENASGFDGRAE